MTEDERNAAMTEPENDAASLNSLERSLATGRQAARHRRAGVRRGRHPNTATVRHPEIHIRLIGTDGDAFAVLGTVRKALARGGVPASEVSEFLREATSGDYDVLLATCMAWVDVL